MTKTETITGAVPRSVRWTPGLGDQNPICQMPHFPPGRPRRSQGAGNAKKRHPARNPPKHLRPGMIWLQNAPIQ